MSLSRFFTLEEMTVSSTAKALGLSNLPTPEHEEQLRRLANAVLDPLREAAGEPLKVTSGYRSAQVNANIRGASKTSQHLLGQAADLQPTQMSVLDLFKLVVKQGLPFDQVIFEAKNASSKWVHVSHSEGANRGEIRVAQFDANGNPTGYPMISAEQALAMSDPTVSRSRGASRPQPELVYEEGHDEPEHAAPAAAPAPAPAAPKKKPAAKKVAAKKAPAKKAAAKKAAPKKAAGSKPAAKKAVVKKAAAKQAPAKKAPAKKAPAKKAAAKQAPAKKAPAKKAAVKTAAVKKRAAKKVAAPAKKAAARKKSR
jgi:Peptidase M15